MKILSLLFLLTQFSSAKTWLQIASKENYQRDHSGRHIRDITPGSPALEYQELNRKLMIRVTNGESGICPCFFDELKWETKLNISALNLNTLFEYRTSQQDWDTAIAVLELSERFKALITQSEPSLVWLLITSAPANRIFQSLEHLADIEDLKKRKEMFNKLQKHWMKLKISRLDFLHSRKGETRFILRFVKNIKAIIKKNTQDLEKPSMFYGVDAPHKLTARELLELPVDAELSQKQTLADLEVIYDWIKSEKPFSERPELDRRDSSRQITFYQEHENGLFELFRDSPDYLTIASMTKRRDIQTLSKLLA